ncbi:double-strand break repair helicase AddA, partial [Rhodospirillum rubrum]|uniref:double-strand break repair helicase AddA n=1 Tax=Rhodospirillum rubrum TaxID=1085 RepID=UPI0028B1AEB8
SEPAPLLAEADTLDPAKPQRRAADPLASAWVAASAGTGKTKVLTDRVLRLLLAGTPPQRLLCLTFTKAAAAEMANRVSAVLAGWATLPEEALRGRLASLLGSLPEGEEAIEALSGRARRLFAQVLDCPGGLRIQTIHGFCQTLLRRFPLEAGVAPHFEVLDDREAQALHQSARDAVLRAARQAEDGEGGDPALAAALAVVTGHLSESRFDEVMAALGGRRGRLRAALDHFGGAEALGKAIRDSLGLAADDTPETVLADGCAEGAFDGPSLRAAAAALIAGGKTDQERGLRIAAFVSETDPAIREGLFWTYIGAFLTKTDEKPVKTLCTKPVEKAHPGTLESLEAEQQRIWTLRERLRAATTAQASEALLTLVGAMLKDYQRRKRALGRMDYEDLILAARRLLAGDGAAAWVLFKLDGGLDHLLVDEAQDTSPDQWAIASALAGEFFTDSARWDGTRPRTVFAVGDRKQSIYGFQGADPKAFEDMRRHFHDAVSDIGGHFAEVPLNISFRSTRAVLEAVNAVFARQPARDGVAQDDADSGVAEDITHHAFRKDAGGLVELWPAMEPAPRVVGDPWKPPVERIGLESARARLAKRVAQRIKTMTSGGELLESQGRPIRPGDILVLVRRRGGFEEELVSALKSAKVEVAGVDRMTLTDQLAVMDLIALGKALLLPEDDLTLASVLKGPLIGLDEDALFTLARDRGRDERLWDRLRPHAGAENAYGKAMEIIEPLRDRAGRLAPHEFYAHVLDGPLNGRRLLLGRLGPEAEDPIDEFLALTLAHERVGPPALQGFLSWLEKGTVEIKRDLDQGALDAVRIMTVHGSKGLQAPVVFLPDTLAKPTGNDLLLWTADKGVADALPFWCPSKADRGAAIEAMIDALKVERDREYRRLLYVAMTRAADRLYICGWETLKRPAEDCWYALIHDALAASAQTVEVPLLDATGALKDTEVLRLTCPQEGSPSPSDSAAPADEEGEAPAAWAALPPPLEPTPSRPLAPSHVGDEGAARSPLDGRGDPRRFLRGRLIHKLLQLLPELPDEDRGPAARRWLSRPAWALEAEEIGALSAEVLAVLDDPAFRAVFAPGSRAEVPLVGLVGNHVVSGQVDRLAVTDDEVLIVDYKTNRPPPRAVDLVDIAYIRQMAAYRALLAQVFPSRVARCVLLWTDGPFAMEIPAERLAEEARKLGW